MFDDDLTKGLVGFEDGCGSNESALPLFYSSNQNCQDNCARSTVFICLRFRCVPVLRAPRPQLNLQVLTLHLMMSTLTPADTDETGCSLRLTRTCLRAERKPQN